MLIRNMMRKYYEEAGADGAASGGAGGEPEKTFTAAEVEELTKGMKSKLDELLREKKTASQAAKDADAARIAAEQAAAKQIGSMEQLEKSVREQKDAEYGPMMQQLEALKVRQVATEKRAILAGFTGEFIAPESVDLVSQLVKTELDGDQVKTQFTDFSGNVITTDPAEFKKWMAKHPAISHLMKADAASGGGAAGGKGGNGSAGTINRSQFDKLDHGARKQFFANGGKLID